MAAPRLRIESGEDRGRELELTRPFVIGRAASCDVVLSDESSSRMHARVSPQGDRARVEDLGSTNGTLINGERVEVGTLEDGDRLMIGGSVLRFYRAPFSSAETVILGNAARDGAAVIAERATDPPPDLTGPAREILDATIGLLEETRGSFDRQGLARSLCNNLMGLIAAERCAVILFRSRSRDFRNAQLVSVPEMRFEPNRSWVQKAVNSRQALLLQDGAEGSHPLYGLVVPVQHGSGPQMLVYADRRTEPFGEAELAAALHLIRSAAALHQSTLAYLRMRDELIEHRARVRRERRIVGESTSHQEVIGSVRRVAQGTQPVLFIGETGTGKELLARLLHDLSARSSGPFITLNCSATPEDQLEAEVLGSGTASGDRSAMERPSALERAAGGTLFLDEIDALDLPSQSRLATALRERKVVTEADGRQTAIDVRLVAASDRDLSSQARSGTFHEDLLALLALGTIPVPPLRSRQDDIPLLADHFLKSHARRMNRTARRLTGEALRVLRDYSWPGNVRELSNVLERAVMLSRGEEIDAALLPFEARPKLDEQQLAMTHAEKIAIENALRYCKFKKGKAAQVLGISWPTLNKKINEYGIEVPKR